MTNSLSAAAPRPPPRQVDGSAFLHGWDSGTLSGLTGSNPPLRHHTCFPHSGECPVLHSMRVAHPSLLSTNGFYHLCLLLRRSYCWGSIAELVEGQGIITHL